METKTKPTESQIEVMMSDWLGNLRMGSEGNYTHKGKGGIRHKSDKTFQDYLLGSIGHLKAVDLIKKARQAACSVVDAITGEPVSVYVGGTGSFQTSDNGRKVINIATDYFDDPELTSRQKVDIMLGLASHEAAHVVYTSDEDETENLKDCKNDAVKNLKHQIWNILEDERIEYLLGEDRPGVIDSLAVTKEHFYKRLTERTRQNGQMPTEPIPKLISSIICGVRYPSEMTREQVEDNFDELDAIRRTLTPYPLNSKDTWAATDRIMDIIKDTMKKQMEEDKKKQQQQQEQQQGQQQSPNGQQGNNSNGGKPDPNANQQSKNSGGKNKKDDNSSNNSNGQGQQPQPTEEEIQQAIADALSTQQGKNVMDAIKQDQQNSSASNRSKAIKDSDNQRYVNEDDAEVEGGGPGNPKVFVFKPKGTPESYLDAQKDIKAYIPAMSKALACKSHDVDYELRGLPSGKLNTNKLVSLKMGNKTIFDKKGTISCSSASVCILIDESGSMSGDKLIAARKAAILVNEAVKRIDNVTYFCYGYTDDRLNVYSEGTKTSKWSLGATEARGGTPTGKAMKMCAKRLRKFTGAPCLMLVLTDGVPDSNPEVIQQDTELRKDKFLPIGVGIQSSAVSKGFQKYVELIDMAKFPFDLGRLTKGVLDKMLVKTDSL